MKLEEYLQAIRECSDEFVLEVINEELKKHLPPESKPRQIHKLTAEWGIYDNWPIFLNAHFDEVFRQLEKSGNYQLQETTGTSFQTKHMFNYIPGTVLLQVFNWIPPFFVFGSKEDKQKQQRDYNMTIMLHPYQKRKIGQVHDIRALANVVDDIGKLIIREVLPACMPYTIGWNYLSDNDYPRIVYYNPNEDQK